MPLFGSLSSERQDSKFLISGSPLKLLIQRPQDAFFSCFQRNAIALCIAGISRDAFAFDVGFKAVLQVVWQVYSYVHRTWVLIIYYNIYKL